MAGFRRLLQNILTVNTALVGTVYGMNFENMPELAWQFGYPLAVR